jgi:flagellar protein FliO/FliZ
VGFAVRRRRATPPAPARATIAIVARQALARDAGIALVEVSGRRVLVGFGAGGGVTRLANLPPASGEEGAP